MTKMSTKKKRVSRFKLKNRKIKKKIPFAALKTRSGKLKRKRLMLVSQHGKRGFVLKS